MGQKGQRDGCSSLVALCNFNTECAIFQHLEAAKCARQEGVRSAAFSARATPLPLFQYTNSKFHASPHLQAHGVIGALGGVRVTRAEICPKVTAKNMSRSDVAPTAPSLPAARPACTHKKARRPSFGECWASKCCMCDDRAGPRANTPA
jgi:hypothetical protein